MSRDLLEEAFKKTKEIEEKEQRKLKAAESLGIAAGLATALALDATVVWLIVKFLIGFPLSWPAAVGCILLLYIIKVKFKG